MKILPVGLSVALIFTGCAGRQAVVVEETTARPGIVTRSLNVVRGSPDRIDDVGSARGGSLSLESEVTPLPVNLGETRRLNVRLSMENKSRRIVTLHFPTSQRIEIQLVKAGGEVVTRWSDDRMFSQVVGQLTINPREKVEFTETISTRDLRKGEDYTIEVFLPGQDNLPVVRKPVVIVD